MKTTFSPVAAATRLSLVAASALTALALSAFDAGAADAKPADLSTVGALLPLAQFGKVDNSQLAVAARAGTLASLLAGSEIPAAAPDVTARALAYTPTRAEFVVRSTGGARALVEAPAREAVSARSGAGGSDAEVAARARAAQAASDPADRIRVLLDLAANETLALHGAVTDDYSSDTDIGAEQARSTFNAVAQQLRASAATRSAALALDSVKTARLMQAERAADGPVQTRVKAYLFEVPYAVGSIPVFGAETVVGVHRSGQIASIRITGPQVSAAANGATIRRAVSAEALEKRARAENPGATIVALGLRYPWQVTDSAAQAVRPHQAFQVVPQGQAEGLSFSGRAHYVFYSVEDTRTAALVWPKARPEAVGDKR